MMDEDLDRTFRVNFTNDGAAKLRESVREKLKEFMGDYTDDTLVEYVIVLLRNGRRKDEAKNELNVFLGDDTDAFVSWLWDHLSVHLHLYVPQQEPYIDELAETKPAVVQDTERSASPQLDSESERETSIKESKSRRNREWKGLVRDEDEPPPLRSSEIEHFHVEKKNQQKPVRTKRYRSPQPPAQKRSRQDDRQPTKREVPSRPLNDAPRRLLQFAVRDAVGTTRPSVSKPKSTFKRLRSVVSTSTADITLDEEPQRIRSVPRLSSAVTTAFKAAAEAAEDVSKVRGSANVFDRLGHSVNVSGVTTHASEVKEIKDVEYVDFDNMVVENRYTNYHEQNEYVEDVAGNTVMLDRNADTAYDSASDNDGYREASQTATSYGQKDDDSLTVQYSVAKNTNEIPRMRVKDQNSNPIGATTSRKIVNISVNVNTWKPSHYQVPQDRKDLKKIEAAQVSDVGATKPGTQQLMNENKQVVYIDNEKNGATIPDSQKTPPSAPGSYSLGHPSEDADSRTIYVSNVHFAATKDTLSRHFNKFGEVLKVVIVTDTTTGQPTGSAYVEFMRKGAAELALSLNGTSFMSRILKVVRKSVAYTEPSNVMTWPRGVTRASPYGATRLARSPFPRGMTAYRGGRLAVKPGARSLQWKRESSTTPTADATVTTPTTPTARSLTYVRKDATIAEVSVPPV
ncbi:hypothetical protein ACHQM5_018776 [Ranunculus cassubicifolius]